MSDKYLSWNPADLIDRLVSELKEWLDRHEQYEENGMRWKKGLAFIGAPGTGKGTAVELLASRTGLAIYTIDLSEKDLESSAIRLRISFAPVPSIIAFDEIDKVRPEILNAMLPILDGPTAIEGYVIVMMTNDTANLSKPLLRDGRVDKTVEFQLASRDSAAELFKGIVGGDELLAGRFGEIAQNRSPAKIQSYLRDRVGEPEKAMADAVDHFRSRTEQEAETAGKPVESVNPDVQAGGGKEQTPQKDAAQGSTAA
ncbi:hypothetical protein NKR23_g12148 [Pleurostoma richardsiae]|uniref:ATPase AAA-type core domain-containing protein n=1 Tax=Pleurostoma richardsiae TaxID=41990 RepID=A0AA38VB13_9PEZI|nr:hypothetical protein NKR23_g12148 [Pleurostoma richardsiae]